MPLLRRSSFKKELAHTDGDRERKSSISNLLHRKSSRDAVKPGAEMQEQPHPEQTVLPGHVKSSNEIHTKPETAASSEADYPTLANGLSKDDVKNLFLGAPHFMLEKGKHGKWFPQAFFPWESDLDVLDLKDRRLLQHESFGLTTLHAHLPTTNERHAEVASGVAQKREDAWKRPMFDLGVFEAPNMLSLAGEEPGTVGMRFYLELPVAERLRSQAEARDEEQNRTSMPDLAHMNTHEAFAFLQHESGNAQVGKHAPPRDRFQLIRGGPGEWKHIGVRDIPSATIIDRFVVLCGWHDEVLAQGFKFSVLHKQKCASLYEELFSTFLYPPQTVSEAYRDHPRGLKVQIEGLVKTLTVPGAWMDFSLVEGRVRLGQVLWDPDEQDNAGMSLPPGGERKWLAIQLLLAVELLIRVDAALRLGSSHEIEEFRLSGDEIHQFNRLRNLKVDWDLVVARRYLDTVDIKRRPTNLSQPTADSKQHQSHLLSGIRQQFESRPKAYDDWSESSAIVPRLAKLQVEAVCRFAQIIEWPNAQELEAQLTRKLLHSAMPPEDLWALPAFQACPRDARSRTTGEWSEATRQWVRDAYLTLQPEQQNGLGGWISHSWFTAFIIPGEAGSLFIMACLLEHSAEAIQKLGTKGCFHGGLVLDGRSWWNKICIVGRVLAPSHGSTECMGWIHVPQAVPVDPVLRTMVDQWLDVHAEPLPRLRKGARIHDHEKVADESNVLGAGHGKVFSAEFVMVTDSVFSELPSCTIKQRDLILEPNAAEAKVHAKLTAAITFTVETGEGGKSQHSLPLKYNVAFISAHPCRPPHGHAVLAVDPTASQPHHVRHEHLPAHPLHATYRYRVKSIPELVHATPPDPVNHDSEVLLIDARGEPDKDIFVRAWCAQVGRSALVARAGKTCLSCAIRECRALQVGIVIRIGTMA